MTKLTWLGDRVENTLVEGVCALERIADSLEKITSQDKITSDDKNRKADPEAYIKWLVEQIDTFDQQCKDASYTDTDEVWQYLNTFREEAKVELQRMDDEEE